MSKSKAKINPSDSKKQVFELVRYKYGTGGRYTAFCLTPKYEVPITRIFNGKELTSTNEGASSLRAGHFQSPDSAWNWANRQNIEISGWNPSPLEGTRLWP